MTSEAQLTVFLACVRQMRLAQHDYYREPDYDRLQLQRASEKYVDKFILVLELDKRIPRSLISQQFLEQTIADNP